MGAGMASPETKHTREKACHVHNSSMPLPVEQTAMWHNGAEFADNIPSLIGCGPSCQVHTILEISVQSNSLRFFLPTPKVTLLDLCTGLLRSRALFDSFHCKESGSL